MGEGAVGKILKQQQKEFYEKEIKGLFSQWKKRLNVHEDYLKVLRLPYRCIATLSFQSKFNRQTNRQYRMFFYNKIVEDNELGGLIFNILILGI